MQEYTTTLRELFQEGLRPRERFGLANKPMLTECLRLRPTESGARACKAVTAINTAWMETHPFKQLLRGKAFTLLGDSTALWVVNESNWLPTLRGVHDYISDEYSTTLPASGGFWHMADAGKFIMLFNGELITGKMFWGKCLCPFECFFPVPQGLTFDAINQIHANVFESHLSKGGEGGFIFCSGLSPAQEREDFVIERLNTQTDPVKTKVSQGDCFFVTQVGRIRFNGELPVPGNIKGMMNVAHKTGEPFRIEKSGRPSPKVHRIKKAVTTLEGGSLLPNCL